MKTSICSALLIGLTAIVVAACGSDDPECRSVEPADFDETSGWETEAYAPRTTEQGCYPFRASSDETFEDFLSMRTSETTDAQLSACKEVLTAINCGTYSNGSDELAFFVEDPDRLSVQVVGELDGRSIDTTAFFNPCQAGCLSFVTLEEMTPDAQKICDIPSQGLASCLFPESAHSLTFLRAGEDGVEVRIAGEALPVLERQ